MQEYRARYERGVVVPLGNPQIPEGSEIIIRVLDSKPSKAPLNKQKGVDAIKKARGMFAGSGMTVEKFLAERRAEEPDR